MTNLIWVLVIANIGYLVFAVAKAKRSKGFVPSVASEVRSLVIPHEMLSPNPVGKVVTIKSDLVTDNNPWEQKISRPEYWNGGRKNLAHDQLLLKDIL